MKNSGVTVFAALSWVTLSVCVASDIDFPTQHARSLQSTECYTNLDEVNALEDAVSDFSVTRTYILCPGTTFTMGTTDSDGVVVGGFAPLRPRSNVIYKCGETGESFNRCVFEGGDYAIFTVSPLSEDLTNVFFQGLTLQSQLRGGIVVARSGDITFSDCVIRDQVNSGAVKLLYEPPSGRRLETNNLSKGEANQRSNRDLQMSNLVVLFDRVLFESNSGVPSNNLDGTIYPGIVTAISEEITMLFQESVFRDNIFDVPGAEVNYTYAIKTVGPLTLLRSCFENNVFLEYAPAISRGIPFVQNSYSLESATNSSAGSLECDLVARFPTSQTLELGVGSTCIPSDSLSCLANLVTGPPTDVPSALPSAILSVPPTEITSAPPSEVPSAFPSVNLSVPPSETTSTPPSEIPSALPSVVLSSQPTDIASAPPSAILSVQPTEITSTEPTPSPVVSTTLSPTTSLSDIPTVSPVAVPQCLPFAAECTLSNECCSQRCLFGSCQRPFVAASNRQKLAEGRGGAAGVVKLSDSTSAIILRGESHGGRRHRTLDQQEDTHDGKETTNNYRLKPRIRGR